jgi:hypothetical protein
MAGRGGHEKTLGELKTHLAFDTVPCEDWDANCMWQLLVGLTHNLIRHFQLCTTATRRPKGRKRTTLFVMEMVIVILGATLILVMPGVCGVALVGLGSFA